MRGRHRGAFRALGLRGGSGAWTAGSVNGKKEMAGGLGMTRRSHPSVLKKNKRETIGEKGARVPGCCWTDCSWALGLAQLAVFFFLLLFFSDF
jgi:hypothetical protein